MVAGGGGRHPESEQASRQPRSSDVLSAAQSHGPGSPASVTRSRRVSDLPTGLFHARSSFGKISPFAVLVCVSDPLVRIQPPATSSAASLSSSPTSLSLFSQCAMWSTAREVAAGDVVIAWMVRFRVLRLSQFTTSAHLSDQRYHPTAPHYSRKRSEHKVRLLQTFGPHWRPVRLQGSLAQWQGLLPSTPSHTRTLDPGSSSSYSDSLSCGHCFCRVMAGPEARQQGHRGRCVHFP